ncbi:MAG TPA: DoxX family protein [Casimicrobiaceae bacterium]|jgi:putative oxidoreductase
MNVNAQQSAAADGVVLIARIAMSIMFITSGFGKLLGFGATVEHIDAKGVPLPEIAAVIAILIELVGGVAVLVGWKTRWAALATVVFLIVITPIFHNFWAMEGAARMANNINFMKNVTILGGFLLLYAFGPGKFSVDMMLLRRPLQRERERTMGPTIPVYANRARSSPDRR